MLLSATAWLFVAGGALQVVTGVVNLLYPETLAAQGISPGMVPVAVAVSLLVTFALVGAMAAWSWTTRSHWITQDPRGPRRAKWLAIVLVIIGGLGLLTWIASLAAISFETGVETTLSILNLLATCVSIGTLAAGILILAWRRQTLGLERGASPTM